ncbi:MAG: 4-alpha-glucanotransferase, partial [Acidiferrobacterales bacterium]|nr:4-alpha-glucanotransferase [Acidiferrobacterales bacterium]
LDDFALYAVIREKYQKKPWYEWTELLRNRETRALKAFADRHVQQIDQVKFEQFLFSMQWSALRHYANERGVKIFGDMPIFVAHDSAEVWAHREYFSVDSHGHAIEVAGVPPDYFSEEGQRWGNPLFAWETMQEDGFTWWQERMRSAFNLYDLVRIDHFRGFEAYWSIPATAETAIDGEWIVAPGEQLFNAMREAFGKLPVVAEDLGLITEEVMNLRRQFGFPGMCILQFAFDGTGKNPYLPHNHEADSVVYTGTHDNNTTVAWYKELDDDGKQNVMDYLGHPSEGMPWPLIRSAFASVATTAIIPMQDLLELGDGNRMNTPGTTSGNWQWRFDWEQVPENLADRLKHLLHIYGRAPESA